MSKEEKNKSVITDEYIKKGNFDRLYQIEKKYLGIDEEKNGKDYRPSGLAISGGGIRSASFGLGVMQALVSNDKLKSMDYLSTVSGGGYIGSALTWALSMKDENGKPVYGTDGENFPFGKPRKAARTGEAEDEKKDSTKQPNLFLDYIRQHSKYLTPTNKLDIVSLAAVAVRGIFISMLVYFGLMLIGLTIAIRWKLFSKPILAAIDTTDLSHFPFVGLFFPLAMLCFGIYIILGLAYSFGTFFLSNSSKAYSAFVTGQIWNGILWKSGLSFALIGTLPYIWHWLVQLNIAVEAATGSTIFGGAVGLWQYVKAQKNEKSSGSLSTILIIAGVGALLYGMLLSAYMLSKSFFASNEHQTFFIVLTVFIILLALLVNLNMVGPHRIWRNRLMEAFMPNREAINTNKWQKATEADTAYIHQMCKAPHRRPYHLVNTNVILGNSTDVKFAGRGGDNFILSPLYCGSDATGWKVSTEYHSKAGVGGITLATAMATSAAALNPNAGVSGEGVTRNTLVSILLSFMNLRLGYWANNPGKNMKLSLSANFLRPGLVTEIFRVGFTESSRRVQLSDGGHFENMAIYELVRRKAELIVLSDGGADLAFNFDDLANAVEKVRVDFGAKIEFRKSCGLDAILPGTAEKDGTNDAFIDKYAIAKRGFAIADIKYEDGTSGILVYIKLAMINDLPTDVYSYKGVNPDFPHQSTADQFFDEKQFEAYRELGYNITWKMMADPETNKKPAEEQTAVFKLKSAVDEKEKLKDQVSRIFPIANPW